jgi:2,3-bisphosphoglycerate-independent phosphoglycerate mutase
MCRYAESSWSALAARQRIIHNFVVTTITAPTVLVIFDGWGCSPRKDANAIALARTPAFTRLMERYPHTTLNASGEAVGLPAGQMGNSEVGHMNMGAGRVAFQDLTRIDGFIRDGDFFTNPVLTSAIAAGARNGQALHLVGLVSDGGVHSHTRHLDALIEMARRNGVRNLFVHAITDGRDTSPTGGVRYVAALERTLSAAGVGRIASIGGRYFAMDRDRRWERTKRAYDAMVHGIGARIAAPGPWLQQSYDAGTTDEFIEPAAVMQDGAPIGPIRNGDSVICFNFRADRVRQITRAIALRDFADFARGEAPQVAYACFTRYDASLDLPVAFAPQSFSGSLADVLQAHAVKNLRLAETEKYAHVTYFFNCGIEKPYHGEDRVLVPSPKVATYDLQPEMSSHQITDTLLGDIDSGKHGLVICNFANADMVGHTGQLPAAIAAVEALDGCLARLATAMEARNGTLVLTADHGNCEQMWDDVLKAPHTAHTSNPVPFVIARAGANPSLRAGGALCDVAPTILGLMGVPTSPEMTGRDLRQL